ncbi:MAG: hypothetical protein ACYC0X_05290 [Pirellulaceae bacterium]
MDFLSKAYSQLADLFKSMTPGSRITAGMLLIMIIVSLTYLFVFQINTANEYLFGSREFSESELDAMQSAFGTAGLNNFQVVGKRVRVPRGRLVEYLQALSKNNFAPQNYDSAIDEAIASSNSLLDSRPLQDFKFMQANQKKFGQVLSDYTGIDTATVQFQEVRKGGFPPQVERKATVAARATRGELSPGLVQAIRTATSGWFGIRPDDVTIIDLNGNVTFGGDRATREPNGPQTEYAEAKRWYENYWKEKIKDCLAVYPGIVVGVNVELDPELDSESRKVVVDSQPTALESNTYRKTSESKPSGGGRPGAVPNEVPSNTPRDIASIAQPESSLDENREEQIAVAGHEQTTRRKAPLTPTTVTATVMVPQSYFYDLVKKATPPQAGEEPKEPTAAQVADKEKEVMLAIKSTVLRTLPPQQPDEIAADRVEVTSYVDLPMPVVEPPTLAATAQGWFSDNWQNLGLLGVGLLSLWILRSMVRSNPSTTSALRMPMPATSGTHELPEPLPEPEPVILQRRTSSTSGSLRDELTTMVREDPDAAANVLRNWIGDAA